MFSNSAEFYDAIYGKFKDYPAEAKKIADLIAREHPDAKTLWMLPAAPANMPGSCASNINSKSRESTWTEILSPWPRGRIPEAVFFGPIWSISNSAEPTTR